MSINKVTTYEIFPLGGDTNCETCGPSWNSLTVTVNHESDQFYLTESVGCYGGDSVEGGPAVMDYLEGVRDRYDPDDFEDLWRELNA